MKKINFLTVITTLLLMLGAGCAKEQDMRSQNNANGPAIVLPVGVGGTISGYVIPMDAMAELNLSNGVKDLGMFYTASDGSITIEKVPAGVYKLSVHALNPDYMDEILEVVVLDSEITVIKMILTPQ